VNKSINVSKKSKIQLNTMDLACHEGWIPLATVIPVVLKIGFQPSRTPYVFYTLHVFLKKRRQHKCSGSCWTTWQVTHNSYSLILNLIVQHI